MTQAPIKVDARQFRDALGSFTTGVTIVTTVDAEGHDIGLTANSFNSVSLDPPMVLWSLAKTSLSLPAFVQAEYFAVHVLSADQRALSDTFARRGADKFGALRIERGEGDVPLLEGCSARFQCRTAFRYEGGDHEIFVGEVVRFDHFGKAPLVFHSGKYGLVVQQAATRAPSTSDPVDDSSFSRDFLGYLLGAAYSQLFKPIRDEFSRRGLSENEYYLLSILGFDERRPLEEIGALMSFAGHRLDESLIDDLQRRQLLLRRDGELTLTECGHRTMIELFAVAKSAESDAESDLDYSESQLLKQLLRRVIRSTARGLPTALRKR
jgi:3-hydroxy-9,10-secoandrosta-1,3,5(10)-triene-9,17-dione monooxygenase reductase component